MIRDGEQRFQSAQYTVGSPIFGELHRARVRLPRNSSNLASNFSNKVKASAVAPAKTCQHLILMKPPELFGVALHHGRADGYLAIRPHGDVAFPPYAQDGCGTYAYHAEETLGFEAGFAGTPLARGWDWSSEFNK